LGEGTTVGQAAHYGLWSQVAASLLVPQGSLAERLPPNAGRRDSLDVAGTQEMCATNAKEASM